MGIAVLNVCISLLYHSVEIKAVVGFWHQVKNPFIPRQPSKCLLNTLCWYSGFQVSQILDYTVSCTACLCGSGHEVCQWFSSHPATCGWSPLEVEVSFWPALNYSGGTCHTTRSFSLTPWTVLQMQTTSKPAQSGKACTGPSDLGKNRTKKIMHGAP